MSIKVIDFWKMYFFFPRAEITLKFNYPQKDEGIYVQCSNPRLIDGNLNGAKNDTEQSCTSTIVLCARKLDVDDKYNSD